MRLPRPFRHVFVYELFLIWYLKLNEKDPYQTTKKTKKQCKVYIKYFLTLTTVSMLHAVLLLQDAVEYTVYNQLLVRITVARPETSSIHMFCTGQQTPAPATAA